MPESRRARVRGSGTSTRRDLIARFIGLAAGRGAGQAFNALALILVAREAGAEQFGGLAVTLSVLLAVSGFLSLGLPSFALRSAVLGNRDAVGYALFLNLLTSAGIVVAGVLLAVLDRGLAPWATIILAFSVAVEKNVDVRVALGTEFGRSRIVGSVISVRGLGILAAVVVSPALGTDVSTAYVAARMIAMCLSGLVLVRAVRGWSMSTHVPRDGSMASLRGFAVATSAGALRQFDTAIVGIVGSEFSAGLYSAIQKLTQPILLLANSLGVVSMGPATRLSYAGLRRVTRAAMMVACGGLVTGALLAPFSEFFVVLIFGDSFHGGGTAMMWALLGLGAVGATPVIAAVLQGAGMTKEIARNTVVFTLVMLAFLPIGVWRWGAAGGAAVAAVTKWALLLGLFCLARSRWRRAQKASREDECVYARIVPGDVRG